MSTIDQLLDQFEKAVRAHEDYPAGESRIAALAEARQKVRHAFLEDHEKGAAFHSRAITAETTIKSVREEIRGMMDSLDDHVTHHDIHEALHERWKELEP